MENSHNESKNTTAAEIALAVSMQAIASSSDMHYYSGVSEKSPLTKSQSKKRSKSKAAKKARKINRKK